MPKVTEKVFRWTLVAGAVLVVILCLLGKGDVNVHVLILLLIVTNLNILETRAELRRMFPENYVNEKIGAATYKNSEAQPN